jgi:hypothetical protein
MQTQTQTQKIGAVTRFHWMGSIKRVNPIAAFQFGFFVALS